jgi:hypothetical protein
MSQDPWQQVLGNLQLQMTRATFDRWLRGTRLLEVADSAWIVGTPDAYALDWLTNRLMPVVATAAKHTAGHEVTVRFVMLGPDDGRQPAQGERAQENAAEPIVEAVREQRVSVSADGSSFGWDDYYIKLKLAFRKKALRDLRGAPLSAFLCLALHVDKSGVAHPGIKRISDETGYSRRAVIDALEYLESQMHLLEKLPSETGAVSRYRVQGYAWFGNSPAANVLEDTTTGSV